MPKFIITFRVFATVELDQTVIDAVDDDWREQFYNLNTPEDIAGHVGRNLILGSRLSMLDGFADQSDASAILEVSDEDMDIEPI